MEIRPRLKCKTGRHPGFAMAHFSMGMSFHNLASSSLVRVIWARVVRADRGHMRA